MSQKQLAPRAPDSVEKRSPTRRESGVRRVLGEERRFVSEEEPWPQHVDQDAIPTQPANEAPPAPSTPAPVNEHRELRVEMPPPSFEEVRDTIPSPPPEREHEHD
jgi:hypothetical protein